MINWKEFVNLRVTRKLWLDPGAKLILKQSGGAAPIEIDLAEFAAVNNVGASDLAKIDGITNGTGAAGKALVLDAGGNVTSGVTLLAATQMNIGGNVVNGAAANLVTGITVGTAGANKALTSSDANGTVNALNPTAFTVNGNAPLAPLRVELTATDISRAVFTADRPYQITSATAVQHNASTSGTAMIEKLTGTTAPGSGITALQSALSLSAAVNTVQNGTLNATVPTLNLAVGDRIGLKIAGTMTNILGGVVTIGLKPI